MTYKCSLEYKLTSLTCYVYVLCQEIIPCVQTIINIIVLNSRDWSKIVHVFENLYFKINITVTVDFTHNKYSCNDSAV